MGKWVKAKRYPVKRSKIDYTFNQGILFNVSKTYRRSTPEGDYKKRFQLFNEINHLMPPHLLRFAAY